MTLKIEGKWLLLIALTGFVLFANSFSSEFVYDDRRQIVMNALIQEPDLYSRALTSDVWAFKSDGAIAASNYWRPTFTAWCIINFKLFGLAPFGWHVLNVLLHIGVCLIAYLLMRRWGLSEAVAFAVALIFTVHPAHTESVAWVSGAPDLLFGIFLLTSFWFADKYAAGSGRSRKPLDMGIALLCFFLAAGAKEVAFLCFPIYYLIFDRRTDKKSNKKKGEKDPATFSQVALRRSALFAAVGALYFFVRLSIIGRLSIPAEGAVGIMETVMSAPLIFAFYLRQIVFPYWLGPNYGIRPVEQIGVTTVIMPLVISVAAVYGLWIMARASFVRRIGLALFILPMLAVFNISAFDPEQIVHDRYLYIPILGFLLVVIPFAAEHLDSKRGERARSAVLGAAVVLSAILGIQTFLYNSVWSSDNELWHHAVTIDDRSASNWSALAVTLVDEEKYPEALAAYDRSIAILPKPLNQVGRGRALIELGRVDEGVRAVEPLINTPLTKIDAYSLYQIHEALALGYQYQTRLTEAEKLLRDARIRLPIYKAALTEKLAVVLYLQDRKQAALDELESVRSAARSEMLPAAKSVFFRLGMLYAEMGRKAEANRDLREYLRLTSSIADEATAGERQQAAEMLRTL